MIFSIIFLKVLLPFQRTLFIFVSYGNAGHTTARTANIVYKTLGFKWLNQAFCPASAFVSADRYEARNPQRFIHATVTVHCKKTKQPTEWQRNFCCIKSRKKMKAHRTFRHICLCPTQKPTLRKAKRAFILPTHTISCW